METRLLNYLSKIFRHCEARSAVAIHSLSGSPRFTRDDMNDRGQASLVLVLILGLVSIMSVLASSTLSVSNVQIEDTITDTNQAWYAAWSGIDEIMYRLYLRQKLESVEKDVRDGRLVSHEEVVKETSNWFEK